MKFVKIFLIATIFSTLVSGCEAFVNPRAEIIVTQDETTIVNNTSIYDFGKVEVSRFDTAIFKIQTKGKEPLRLTGTPIIEITGLDGSSYSVSVQPETSIKEGEWTTFTLKFSPTESKFYEASVSIANNDIDNNPFVFTVKGRGVIIDIEVWQNKTPILNDTGLFDFGDIYIGYTGFAYTFTIKNIGSTKLYLTGTQDLITLQGNDSSDFIINQNMTNSELDPDETTTFEITFDPQTSGSKTARIFFENSDQDENPFNFTISGFCMSPEVQVLDPDSNNIPNYTGEYVLPTGRLKLSNSYTFTIKNNGTTDLILTGTPLIEISGLYSEVFTVSEFPDKTISASSNTTFVIAFLPTSEIEYSATVTFLCNDEDESLFTFTIRGTGLESKFDFNGDGFEDILVSPIIREKSITNFNIAYLFLGSADYPKSMNCNDADTIFTFTGNYDDIGVTAVNAGDINADGYNDILIGNSCWKDCGQSLIFFGRPNPPSILKYTDADVVINPDSDLEGIGGGVSAGDFNNDGYDDFMIGASFKNNVKLGCILMFLGRKSWDVELSSSDASMRIIESYKEGSFGYTMSGIGDYNGDGFDDIIIGNGYITIDNGYIFYGEAEPPETTYANDADVTIEVDFDIYDNKVYVSKAGDVNNDGYDDVIVGYPQYDIGSHRSAGCAYVFFGNPNSEYRIGPLDAGIKIVGNNQESGFGGCVSHAGDVNNDGFDDIIISETNSTHYLTSKNANVYVYYGSSSPKTFMELLDADIQINMLNGLFSYGSKRLSSAGDFNGDGIDDFFFAYYIGLEYKIYMFNGKSTLRGFFEMTDADLEIYTNDSNTYYELSIDGG